jgi:hypothetical protein
MGDPVEGLRRQVARWRAGEGRGQAVDLAPASVYEVVTRQMVEQLREDLKEIKGRLNGLLWMVATAILLDIVTRVAGLR